MLVLDFLSQFVGQAEQIDLSEVEAFISLPTFLRGTALQQFKAAKSARLELNGVYSWPSAVHYLLRAYATDDNIRRAVSALHVTTQKPVEREEEYAARLERAHALCGNYLRARDLITLFIERLDVRTRPAVHRYRGDNSRADLLDVLEFAKAEGRIVRARTGKRGPDFLSEKERRSRSSGQVHFADEGVDWDALQCWDDKASSQAIPPPPCQRRTPPAPYWS